MNATRFKKLALLSLLGFVVPPLYAETETTEELDLAANSSELFMRPSAQTPAVWVDVEATTKKWKCKYCPDLEEAPWEVNVGLGLGYVTNDSYKFGEYNGLPEKGGYLSGDVEVLYRDDEANYLNLQVDNLGLDSSYFNLETGRQGTYKLKLVVDQITKYNLDTSRTPYSGGATQTLPGGWVSAGSTAGFTTLANDLRDVNFSTQRRDIRLGGEYYTSQNLSYGVQFRRHTKDGNQPTGFGFGFTRAAILNKPIDYTTDEVELNAIYRSTDSNAKVAFIHSKFENEINAFRWDNAYDSPTGATEGQAGTAPDNTKQQILLTGNYLGVKDLQLTALFSIAQMSQDEAYLPYTVNGSIVTPALPTNSLDGKVVVINTNLAAHWQSSPNLNWHFIFEHHEQDNQTARNTYTYVTADNSITTTPRANFPYSFRTQKLKASADYKIDKQMKLSGGGQLSTIDRDYQAVETTDEKSLWLKFMQRIDNSLQYSLKAEYSDRSIDNYNQESELVPQDNTLMRKYNMADRNGQKVEFNLGYSASANLHLNFSGDLAQYDYDASEIGLTESDEFSVGLDVQYMAAEDLSFSVFVQNTNIESEQAGSTWTASNDDKVLTVGLGSNYQIIEDKLSIGLDYVHADSSAAIDISGGTALPDLTTTRDTIIVHADYTFNEKLSMKASYQYEDYKEDNWSIDDVAPDTLSNVLTLGETAPEYSIGAFWLSLHYRFQ